MLLASRPMRISLGGGGTDLEGYYARYDGLVISTAITKYFYAIFTSDESDDLQVISADYRSLFRHSPSQDLFWDGDLALPKAILHHFGIPRGMNLFVASEIPPGTGLGSSSAAAVTLARATSTLLEQPMTKQEAAQLASHIEITKMGMPIGKQDQYASSFGGLNKNQDEAVLNALHRIKQIAIDIQACLEQGNLDEFAHLLHCSWQEKRKLAPGLSTSFIDECYVLALKHGASGGKIAGAGGGGFLRLYCHEQAQEAVTAALEEQGLKRMNFHFDQQGAKVLLNVTNFDTLWAAPYAELILKS